MGFERTPDFFETEAVEAFGKEAVEAWEAHPFSNPTWGNRYLK